VARVSGTTDRLQRGLHRVLASASDRELNYILCAVNVAAVVEVAQHATMELLVGQRMGALTTVARAALADGLQKLGLRYRPRRQAWVRDVMVATTGLDLTHFKAYMDDGGDYHTMYKLMYNDLQGPVQAEVLAHIRAQGAAVREELLRRGPGAPPGAALKVLSDIDDTVFSSGGGFPAGVDTRYPRRAARLRRLRQHARASGGSCVSLAHHRPAPCRRRKCYYPGALALYAAIDRCFARKYAAHLHGMAKGHPEMEMEEEDDDEGGGGGGGGGGGRGACSRSPSPPRAPRGAAARLPRPFSFSFLSHKPQAGAALQCPGGALALGSSPPLRSLLGDIMTPRDLAAYPEGASPRAAAWAEARAAAPPSAHHQEGSNLVFLSARPESYKGLTESESYRKYFQPLVLRGDLDTSPTMLLGSLDSGPRALVRLLTGRARWLPPDDPNPKTAAAALYQTLAAKKLSRFREYAAIFPEAAFVYVGDNGQGDVLCAEILYSSARQAAAPRPSQLLASFIHRVAPLGATLSMLRSSKAGKPEWLAAWRQRSIYFHRSHVGMAVQAHSMGLIDDEALQHVAAAAALDFRRVAGRYSRRHAGRHLGRALDDLSADLRAASAALPAHLEVPLLEEVPGLREQVAAPPDRRAGASPTAAEVTGLAPMH
jgi:hypothetical protein